jgi:hypothetical protein
MAFSRAGRINDALFDKNFLAGKVSVRLVVLH